MSDSVRPDVAALAALRQLIRHLGEELASFRRRALQAESRLRALEAHTERGGVSLERAQELENENAELRRRLDVATTRAQRMLDRVRFLRQQHEESAR